MLIILIVTVSFSVSGSSQFKFRWRFNVTRLSGRRRWNRSVPSWRGVALTGRRLTSGHRSPGNRWRACFRPRISERASLTLKLRSASIHVLFLTRLMVGPIRLDSQWALCFS